MVDGPERIKELLEWGVEFTRAGKDGAGKYDLGREGGHSMRRVLHARDLTGQEIERALHEKASLKRNIKIFENHIGIDLILESAVLDGKKRAPGRSVSGPIYLIRTAIKSILSRRNSSFWPRAAPGKYILSRQILILPQETALPWPTGREP